MEVRTFSVYSSFRITSGANQIGLSTIRPPVRIGDFRNQLIYPTSRSEYAPIVGANDRDVPKSATFASTLSLRRVNCRGSGSYEPMP